MYVWKFKTRRDRRENASQGLTTLSSSSLALLRQKEVEFLEDEEVDRHRLEQEEVAKHKGFVREALESYLKTPNGMEEVEAVAEVLLLMKKKEEDVTGDDDDDDDDKEGDKEDNGEEKGEEEKKEENTEVAQSSSSADSASAAQGKDSKVSSSISSSFLPTTSSPPLDSASNSNNNSIAYIKSLKKSQRTPLQNRKVSVYSVFRSFDADASNSMSRSEFRACVDELCIPLTEQELDEAMAAVDEDKSGEVDFEEFFDWYEKVAEKKKRGAGLKTLGLRLNRALKQRRGDAVKDEARRIIIAHGERGAEEYCRSLFRKSRPPRFCCEYCGESFEGKEEEGVHFARRKELHANFDASRKATLERQLPVKKVLEGAEKRKWLVRRLIHSQHLYDPRGEGGLLEDVEIWKNKTRPLNADPGDKRGEQLRRGQLVEGFDAKMGKRPGYVQRGFLLRDRRPGEGKTRNHMACNPMLLPDYILRLYMDKQPHITKSMRKQARKRGVPLALDDQENTFFCDPASGQSKALVSFAWRGLVYQGADVLGEFNGYRGERMESQGHINSEGVSEFVLERNLSPGVYHYYFLIDGRKKVDQTKPCVGKGTDKRNVVTVCNPSILGGQGGPHTDGRLALRNAEAVRESGLDPAKLLEASGVDGGKFERRLVRKLGGAAATTTTPPPPPPSSSSAVALRTPNSAEGLEPVFNPLGGKKLTKVELVHNLVCDDGAWALAQAMINNHRIVELDLSSNMISSDGIRHISYMLGINSSIVKLRLNNNCIGYDGARALAEAIIHNDELKIVEIEMAQNSLGDDGIEALCSGIAGCGTITSLNLDGNGIHDDGAGAIGDMLGRNKIIISLSLGYNNIGKEGCLKLSASLRRNCSLRTLNLNRNPLGPPGVGHLSEMLRYNDTLSTLKFGYTHAMNKGDVIGLFELCRALRINRSLTSLDFSGNEVGESDFRKLLTAIHDLDNPSVWTRKRNNALFTLKLEDNPFDGEWLVGKKMVTKNGFAELPSVPLYLEQNAEAWAVLPEEQRMEMTHWLSRKKEKRKNAEKNRKARKLEMDARIEQQKLRDALNRESSALTEEEKERHEKERRELKRAGLRLQAGGMESSKLKEEFDTKLKEKELKKKKRDQRMNPEDGEESFDDEASVSSLGSYGDEGSIVSSVSGGISNYNKWGGDQSYTDSVVGGANSIKSATIHGQPILPLGPTSFKPGSLNSSESSIGPSIDSDFLLSMRESLFGTNSSAGSIQGDSSYSPSLLADPSSPMKLLENRRTRFKNSSMFSVTPSESINMSVTTSNSSLMSDDSSYLSGSRSTTSTSTFSLETKTASTPAAALGALGPIGKSKSALSSSTAKIALADISKRVPKIRAREEGEWRVDRTWISQRSLDRAARRLAEDAAREKQTARQAAEDKFVDEKVAPREETLSKYLEKDDGLALVQAVVDELKELRKESEAAEQDRLNAIRRRDLIEKTDKYPEELLRYEVHKVFDIFDGDASDQIGVEEFGDLMKELCIPMSNKELRKLVAELDDDKSGELDFEEFFVWYKDNHKEKRTSSVVGGFLLKAQAFINSKMGATARLEARRIILANELRDVVTLARHEFRETNKPQFECMECQMAFVDKKSKKDHDANSKEIHERYHLLADRAAARKQLIDVARFKVTRGEVYPRFFVYPPDVPDHVQLPVYDRPDLAIGRPLGVININTCVIARARSGEKGTGDWIKIDFQNCEEAWVQQRRHRPYKEFLIPMDQDEKGDAKKKQEEMKQALSGKKKGAEATLTPEEKRKKAAEEAEAAKKRKKEGLDGADVVLPEIVEMEEIEEEVEEEVEEIDSRGQKKKVKKMVKKKRMVPKKKKVEELPEWPKRGHVEFFTIPKWYSFAPDLGPGTELNVRALPKMDGAVIGYLISTETVKAVSRSGDWLCIQYKSYDGAWMLLNNRAHDLLKPASRELADMAERSKMSPFDWTYDYILMRPNETHITAGSRDAMGAKAHEEEVASRVSTSTKAQLGLGDQLTEEIVT